MNRVGIIYKAVGPTGKVYIGKTTKGLEYRKKEHIRNAFNKNNREYNIKFYKAIRKYNDNIKWFVEIENVSIDIISALEQKTIAKYNSYKNGYNSTLGGDGVSGLIPSKETRLKISKKLSGKNNPFYGKKHSKETVKLLSAKAKDRKLSDATKKKISKTLSKKFTGSNNPFYGRKHSHNTKTKISIMGKGRSKTKEHRKKISESNKKTKRKNILMKKRQFSVFEQKSNRFVGSWVIIKDCAESLNLCSSSIVKCLKGKQKQHKGYIFMYYREKCNGC